MIWPTKNWSTRYLVDSFVKQLLGWQSMGQWDIKSLFYILCRPNVCWPNVPRPNAPWQNAPWPNAPWPNAPWPNAPWPNASQPNAPRPKAPRPNPPVPNDFWPKVKEPIDLFVGRGGQGGTESGIRDEFSDVDGRSLGWLPRIKFSDCVSRGQCY